MKTFLRDTLITLILAALIFLGLQVTVGSVIVDGPSMMPNFQDGQRLLVNKAVYKFFHPPERGDVIIFHLPGIEEGDFIKRVIGLPGESVEIKKDGTVYIHKEDGSVIHLDEPYVTEAAKQPYSGKPIPENEYFVLGDNRNNSSDSRNSRTLPGKYIIGKAWLSIWPPDEWRVVTHYPLEEQTDSLNNSISLTEANTVHKGD